MNNINNLTPVDFNPFSDSRKIEKVTYTTEAQKEIWLACAIGEQAANLSYNESVSLALEGNFQRDAFESALQQLIRRHEALRATVSSNGEYLIIYDVIPYEPEFHDFSEIEDGDKQRAFEAFLTQQMHIAFDIKEGPLFRFFIHKFSSQCHYFTLFKHHIIGDGWSTGVLLEDLSKLYNGFVSGMHPMLPVPYQISAYAKEELRYQQTPAYKTAEQYWINLYSGDIPVLDLPTDDPRKSPRSFKGHRLDFELSQELIKRVRQVGAKVGCSLVNTLVAAFELFLHKTTKQQDITVGLPTAGQLATEKFDLVGHCVNLLPLRSKIDTTVSINEYLESRRRFFFDAYDNQRFTFGELVKKLKIPRDDSRIPLIPVMFNVDAGMDNAVSFDGLKHTLISNPREFEAFELFLNVTNAKDRLILEWSYNSDLFKPETIQSMMAAFEYLLMQVADNPNSTIQKLRLTDSVRPKSIVTGEQLDYDKSSNFTKLIATTAHEKAEKTAVIFESRRINYRQLESRTNQFAHYLSSAGVKKGAIVGVAMGRSIDMLVALIGIAKSGGVYLPLDPEYPEERIEFMLQDSGARYLLTDTHKHRWASDVSTIVFDDIQAKLDAQQTCPPQVSVTGDDLVYLLYTSGSSGKPKGVQIKHSNLLNFLLSMQHKPGIKPEDIVFNITTISFDIAGLELYLPLIAGATLVLSDQETTRDGRAILRSLADKKISFMQATPSTWRMMLDAGWEHRIPLKALCGGEPFPIELADKLLDRCQSVWNMYGPTETTIWSTIKEITRADNGLITVGNPIANTTVYILDEHRVPVAVGEVGELFIAGDGVAKGYLNRPELNEERFITERTNEHSYMYATGDLGKITNNGEIQCLGRKDNQVKIRGHRIELGEIEYQLSTLRGIKEAIVDVKPTPQGDAQLIAYIIGDREGNSDDSGSVSWKDRWDTIYETGVAFNKSANLSEHQIDGSIHRQLENSEELKYQAEEWLDESVNRIREIGARRIVEVGSGAGQILFKIAPSASYYLATDYAHTAIDKLSEQLAAHPDKWGHVDAKTAPADDFSGIPPASLDLVLINSVAQYFPDANYFLTVIENAAKVVKPGGCIFIGDMQGKNSLEMCHAIDQFRRSSDDMALSRFQEVVKNRVRIEEELVADPGFFYLLPKLIPAITAVDVQLRKGLLLNETTNYHFDVWLYVNSAHEIIAPDIDYSWDDVKSEDGIRQILSASSDKTISITGIPNQRTAKDFRLSTILQFPEAGQKTIGEIKPQLQAVSTGLLPDTFWAIGEQHGYDTRVRWTTDGTDGCFEAIFLPPNVKNAVPAKPAQLNTQTKKVADFIRQPNVRDAARVSTEIAKLWKNELSKILPDYMVPVHFVTVQKFPLTPNKKVDRKALRAIDWQPQEQREHPPKSDMEKLVASIWEDCLGVTGIGLQDNFFDIGGHSLIAVKVVALVVKKANVSVPFSSLFKFPKLADFAFFVENEISKLEITPSTPIDEREAKLQSNIIYAPITESQQEIWLACKMGGQQANKAYTLSYTTVFNGQLNIEAMRRATHCLIAKHDSLRAVFSEDGQTMVIHSTVDVKLTYKDISHMAASEKESFLKDFDAMNRDLPFDLEAGPLVRFALIRTSSEEHRFYFFTHHIICDGWSLRVILKDLSGIYSALIDNTGFDSTEAPSFGTYAQVLNERLAGRTYTETVNFWKKLLTPLPPPLDLPLDFARPEKRTYNSRHEVYQISNEVLEGLKKLGKDANCSLAITFRVAFEAFLYRLTNQADLVVGLPISGQITENLENLVGHTIFLLPMRAQLQAGESFIANLKIRKREILLAYDHYGITFGSLLRELSIQREESRMPLVPIVLNIHMDDLSDNARFSGLTSSSSQNQDHQAFSGFELALNMTITKNGLNIDWFYNHDLFTTNTIDSFQERFEYMLNTLIADSTLPLREIPLVDQQLLRATLEDWNRTYEPYDKNSTVHQLISECATRFPNKIALSYLDQQITYRELEAESNSIARFLIEQGVRKGDPIGVAVERSISMITTLVAIMKAGAIYLPFETSHPKSRIRYILKETSAKYLITSVIDEHEDSSDTPILLIEDIQRESHKLSSDSIQGIPVTGDDLVYILHTSGSTGKPKGVKIRHRNVVNFLNGMLTRPGIQPEDRLLAVTPVSFDMAVLMYLPLVCGAEVVIADEASSKDGRLLHHLMVERDISWMIATPATWQMIIDSGWEKSHRLLAISAGEALSKDLAKNLIARCSSVWNGYGPTETTVMVMMKEVLSSDDSITLGTPINNTSIYIVDKDDQLAAIGQEGEILIGGDGVGAGYLGLPELTTKSFIKNPFSSEDGGTLYRTGDLGKYLPNGEVLYLGRNDHQVKIRGHRIELGEIEQTLLQLHGIKSAVVEPFGDLPNDTVLVGYIVPQDEPLIAPDSSPRQTGEHTISYAPPSETDVSKWKAHLKEQLPEYMVPHEFLYLTSFPLTENGKVDRKKLPPPLRQFSPAERDDYAIPTTATEMKLANIWKGLLKVQNIGIKENFFHLGGHSLMAVKMMIQIEQDIGERLPISSLIKAPNIRALAQLIDRKDHHVNWESLVPIKSAGKKPPLYVVHGIGLNVLFFHKAVSYLHPEQPVFALQSKGLDGIPRPNQTLEGIAADYVQEILQHNSDGPYALSGYSYGGIVAVEMARQLKKMGKEVSFLGLFDSYTNLNIKQHFKGNRKKILKHKIKKLLMIPVLFLRNPKLYLKDKYYYGRGIFYSYFKKIFPEKRLFNDPPAHVQALQKQHTAAMNNYVLHPYDGSMVLFKSKVKTLYIPYFETNGWQPHIQGDIDIVEIPCNHAQLFLEPAVKILAQKLQEKLDETFKDYQFQEHGN